ncbi:hypothetical protein FRX31_029754 [Thalictrum thalictroides]|uniref:Uncharacterized protein n=1 Tax=Thalictrum thalictroides TaxID=46969 RepID=A0A7J6V6D8_THATH|nr:hypothetical protein FRX31_029754 [Thalictrum thalictroides]
MKEKLIQGTKTYKCLIPTPRDKDIYHFNPHALRGSNLNGWKISGSLFTLFLQISLQISIATSAKIKLFEKGTSLTNSMQINICQPC